MSMSVVDYTAQAWLQGFNDVGVVIFGMSADELFKIRVRCADIASVIYSDDVCRSVATKSTVESSKILYLRRTISVAERNKILGMYILFYLITLAYG